MKPWLSRRLDYGHYDRLMRELEAEDVVSFRNFVRMDPAMFKEVLQRVGPRIEKYDTWFRKSINPGCRLAITSFLGHWREVQESDVWLQGSTQHHLSHSKADL